MTHFVIPEFHLVKKYTQSTLRLEQCKYIVINNETGIDFTMVKLNHAVQSLYAMLSPFTLEIK